MFKTLQQAVIVIAILVVPVPKFFNWYYSITTSNPSEEYDFIIVGAGNSGSVVANRLTEAKDISVLVLEAGKNDEPNFRITVPMLAAFNEYTDADWVYKTVPQKNASQLLKNQQSYWPRGKTLGGSTSINYMNFVRGSKHDYNAWKRLGAVGWGYKDVIKYFKKFEDVTETDIKSDLRGYSGPLKISYSTFTPLAHAFMEAGKELDYKSGDSSGEGSEGFHFVQSTVHKGKRQSASTAFLRPIAKARKNHLHIVEQAHVRQITIRTDADGTKHSTGVIYIKDGKEFHVHARKEVILSVGAIGSPQILMLSGIGPKEHLENIGINTLVDLKGVGANLRDHPAIASCFIAENLAPGSVHENEIKLLDILSYFYGNGGNLGNGGGTDAQAFIRSRLAKTLGPDLQFILASVKWNDKEYGGKIINKYFNYDEMYVKKMRDYGVNHNRSGACDFWMMTVALHPKSVGEIKLQSKDYQDHPLIDPKYLNYKEDIDVLIEAYRFIENLEKTNSFKKMGAKLNLLFDECVGQKAPRSKSCLTAVIRGLTSTLFHPIGTAKMGKENDPMSVVDSRLRVHKVNRLRVVDASIMPDLPSANTQAACYMIGEKAADMIKEDWKI